MGIYLLVHVHVVEAAHDLMDGQLSAGVEALEDLGPHSRGCCKVMPRCRSSSSHSIPSQGGMFLHVRVWTYDLHLVLK